MLLHNNSCCDVRRYHSLWYLLGFSNVCIERSLLFYDIDLLFNFFDGTVIISREYLKQSISEGHCVSFTILATIHDNKRSVVDSRKCEGYVCLTEAFDCIPALLKVPIYSTKLVSVIFVWKCCVKSCKHTKVLAVTSFFVGECDNLQFHNSNCSFSLSIVNLFRRAIVDICTWKGGFWNKILLFRSTYSLNFLSGYCSSWEQLQ